jgi:uncharacterized protein YkwD
MKIKIVFVFLFFLFIFTSFGQTKFDTILFNKINEYRISKNLNVLKWDTIAYKASEHHTKYIVVEDFYSFKKIKSEFKNTSKDTIFIKFKTSPHNEKAPFYSPSDRYKYYGGKKYESAGEVIAWYCENIKNKDSLKYEKLAIGILELWKKSTLHNKIILDPNATKGCGSTIIEVYDGFLNTFKLYFTTSSFIVI